MATSSFWSNLLWLGLAPLVLPSFASAQIRVLERARHEGLDASIPSFSQNYGAKSLAYYDRARATIVNQTYQLGPGNPWEVREWSGRGEVMTAPDSPLGTGAAVCPFPGRPGVGLSVSGIGSPRTYAYENGAWQLLPVAIPYFLSFGFLCGLALDEARQVAVLTVINAVVPSATFGATLEFDGQNWVLASTTQPWTLDFQQLLIYHKTNQRVESVRSDGEIRSWNGSTWTPRVAPMPGFVASGACFDTHRSRLVVLGHFNGSGSVLEYDTNYGMTQLWAGANYPAVIYNAVYDEGRRKIVCTTQDTPTGPLRTRAYEGPSGIIATWSDLGGSTVRPTPRNDAMLAVDDSRGAILFGGRDNNNVPNNETWLWDSRDWTNMQPTTAPAPRSAAGLAGKADRVVLFGGLNSNNQAMGDTWALVGSSWQQLSPLTSPAARFNHAMATNYASGETYLFGGSDGQNWFGDVYKLENFLSLWSWNQVQVGGTGNVGARDLHAIAIDERRNKIVLFGGRNEFFQQLGDTWELDLSQASPSWTQRVSAQSPSGRVNHAMTYDRQRERIVLAGGYDMNTATLLDDIWEWDGVSWAQRTTVMRSIVPTENPAMAYDHRTQRVVLFGGWTGSAASDNTYELVETAGPSAPGQQAPVSLILSSAPTVNGSNTTPLGVDIASSAGLSALFVAIGGAPQPLAYLPTPLFCSSQPFYVQPVASYVGVGNRFSYSVPIPPAAAGMLLSAQGLSFHANGCIDTTDALFVTVQTLQ